MEKLGLIKNVYAYKYRSKQTEHIAQPDFSPAGSGLNRAEI